MNRRLFFFLLIIIVGWLLCQPHDPALRRRYQTVKRSEHHGIEGFGTELGAV